ncbi:lipase member H-A-like [Toxorhynchites rutilus septentrionalis]|uniref:lipase member H-A-like n=1 Tax=Toxorhynchites rutilus septentrionalis TaxID=329112 RepID=UPI0024788FF6|nr:lipase member H-A-like [Toxorhynchites rutilus septentrionalis]
MFSMVVIRCASFIWLVCLALAGDGPIVFREDDEPNSLASRIALELDDMEYERDSDGDSQVPQLLIPRDENDQYVRLPGKSGEFEVVSRFLVRESRVNSSSYIAEEYVRFLLYTRENSSKPVELRLNDIDHILYYGFNFSAPTKILIHGWLGSSESQVIEPLAKDFLAEGDFNVIAVDWEKGAQTWLYPVARYRVDKVADVVAALIAKLVDAGHSYEKIGIVGHSLGAHIAGLTGKRTAQKIGFIIGLDPASPLFRMSKPLDRLAADDAEYVEVIHTNGKALGFFRSIGKADFYPNGGVKQPGCGVSLTCSHERSVIYFQESLKVRNYFGNRCADVSTLHPECTLGTARLGGLELRQLKAKPRGIYYLATAAKTPFLRNGK